MASKSKLKGTAYESKIAKLLTKELGLEFKRVPLSGSIEYLKGDLWTPLDTASFKFTIECKHYKEINFTNLLVAKSNDLFSFWEQAQEEAEVMKKRPLVIFRWNRSKDYVLFAEDNDITDYIEVSSFSHKFKIVLLSDWIEWYKKCNS